MFTGDRSGDFLFARLHETGFASQPDAISRDDGLKLRDIAITAAAHCAPPANKPTREELANCAPFLQETFEMLGELKVVVCLGLIGLNAVLDFYIAQGWISRKSPYRFGHGAEHPVAGAPTLLCSYHPSQQNTFTGKLTEPMLLDVFVRARQLAGL
jgi:uracil-DNA glycosylase family 4